MKINSITEFRDRARKTLPKPIFDVIDGGAGREITLRRNEDAFERILFASRAFVAVRNRELNTTALGEPISLPVIAGSAGFPTMVHRRGELAVASATKAAGTIFCVSTASSYSVEEISSATTTPLWFELFSCQPRHIASRLIEKAQRAKCKAIILAVDYRAAAIRYRNLRNGFSWPPSEGIKSVLSVRNAIDFALHPRWICRTLQTRPLSLGNLRDLRLGVESADFSAQGRMITELMSESSSWDDLRWLRSQWLGPLLVHGIMSPDDAKQAIDLGANGIVVSNHGGRHLDWVPSTMEVLPSIVAAIRDSGADVFIDGGIRHGADVVKALSFGARACFVARPWLWALASAGEAGVVRMFDILRAEIDNTLALIGCRRVTDLNTSVLYRRD